LDAARIDSIGVQRTRAFVHGVKHRHSDIVDEIEAVEGARQLKTARETAVRALVSGQAIHWSAVEMHCAVFVWQRAADAVDERALARAVRPDEAKPFALLHFEFDAVERDETAEALADIADVEESAHFFLQAFMRSCTSPTNPFGATTTKKTSRSPTISKFTADEIVTVASCCSEPSRIAPTSGPIQLVVPPMIGIAIEFTP